MDAREGLFTIVLTILIFESVCGEISSDTSAGVAKRVVSEPSDSDSKRGSYDDWHAGDWGKKSVGETGAARDERLAADIQKKDTHTTRSAETLDKIKRLVEDFRAKKLARDLSLSGLEPDKRGYGHQTRPPAGRQVEKKHAKKTQEKKDAEKDIVAKDASTVSRVAKDNKMRRGLEHRRSGLHDAKALNVKRGYGHQTRPLKRALQQAREVYTLLQQERNAQLSAVDEEKRESVSDLDQKKRGYGHQTRPLKRTVQQAREVYNLLQQKRNEQSSAIDEEKRESVSDLDEKKRATQNTLEELRREIQNALEEKKRNVEAESQLEEKKRKLESSLDEKRRKAMEALTMKRAAAKRAYGHQRRPTRTEDAAKTRSPAGHEAPARDVDAMATLRATDGTEEKRMSDPYAGALIDDEYYYDYYDNYYDYDDPPYFHPAGDLNRMEDPSEKRDADLDERAVQYVYYEYVPAYDYYIVYHKRDGEEEHKKSVDNPATLIEKREDGDLEERSLREKRNAIESTKRSAAEMKNQLRSLRDGTANNVQKKSESSDKAEEQRDSAHELDERYWYNTRDVDFSERYWYDARDTDAVRNERYWYETRDI